MNPLQLVNEDDLRALQRLQVPNEELMVYTRTGVGVSLRDWYQGRSCFLLCGGPSLAKIEPTVFQRRGLVTMGVNNSWAVIRPNLWIGCDHPGRFIDVGWKDAGITKFVPLQQAGFRLRVKQGNFFRDSCYQPTQMPAVWFFHRNVNFNPESFLEQLTVCWGKEKEEGVEQSGGSSTMLAALRLLHYLGFANVYLCGCDFSMERGAHVRNYAWEQDRSDRAVQNNQQLYGWLQGALAALRPKFEKAGFWVWNCTEGSKLEAFEHKTLEQALEEAGKECAKEIDPALWYTVEANDVRKCRSLFDKTIQRDLQ